MFENIREKKSKTHGKTQGFDKVKNTVCRKHVQKAWFKWPASQIGMAFCKVYKWQKETFFITNI